jgi:hypothetical protein
MVGFGVVSSLFLSRFVLGAQAFLWKVFGGPWISPIFSPPSPLQSPTLSEPSACPS